MRVRPLRALFAGLSLLASSCVGSPSGPADVPPPLLEGVAEPSIPDLPGRPFGIRTAPNGTIFVTHQDLAQVTMVPTTGARDSSSVGEDPGDVILSADGTLAIVSTFYGGELHFLDAATGNETDVTTIGSNAYRLALSSSESTVFVTTTGGKVYAVAVANGEKTDSVQLAGSLQGIARRNADVLAVSSSDGVVTLLNAATLDVINSRAGLGTVQDIIWSGDLARLFVAVENTGEVLALDATTLATVDSLSITTAVGGGAFAAFGMALGRDGISLVVSSASPAAIAVIDPSTWDLVQRISVSDAPRRVSFNPEGTRAYIANEGGYVNVIR